MSRKLRQRGGGTINIDIKPIGGQIKTFQIDDTITVQQLLVKVLIEHPYFFSLDMKQYDVTNSFLVFRGHQMDQSKLVAEYLQNSKANEPIHIITPLKKTYETISKIPEKTEIHENYGMIKNLGPFEKFVVPNEFKHVMRNDEYLIVFNIDQYLDGSGSNSYFEIRCITNYGTMYYVRYQIDDEVNIDRHNPKFIGDNKVHVKIVDKLWCLVGQRKLSANRIDEVKTKGIQPFSNINGFINYNIPVYSTIWRGDLKVITQKCSYFQYFSQNYGDSKRFNVIECGIHPITHINIDIVKIDNLSVARRSGIYGNPYTCLIVQPKRVDFLTIYPPNGLTANNLDDPGKSYKFESYINPDIRWQFNILNKSIQDDPRIFDMYLYGYHELNHN